MWVESEVGQGSRFHFTVRLGKGQAPIKLSPAHVGELWGLRVLVVDDNTTNRRILKEVLCSWHMNPSLAASAQEAFSLMQRAKEEGRPFPLVLTDALMPEMDGFELAERINQTPQLAGATIMMLTSADARTRKPSSLSLISAILFA